MAKRRTLARRKKVAMVAIVAGVAAGVTTIFLWPFIKRKLLGYQLTVGTPSIAQRKTAPAAPSLNALYD